ncbi:MAG: DUF1697 domain-containing protein [Acidimicrobiia bacterium]
MARFVAFLRAINTPPRHVKMERLRAVFESLEFDHVVTVIASGNVVFDTNDVPIGAKIETALHAELGFDVPTFLRRAADVIAIPQACPFPDGGDVEVSFLAEEPDAGEARALEATASGSDRLAVVGRELFWSHAAPRRDSSHSEARVVRLLGMATTRRSLRTVRRIADELRR